MLPGDGCMCRCGRLSTARPINRSPGVLPSIPERLARFAGRVGLVRPAINQDRLQGVQLLGEKIIEVILARELMRHDERLRVRVSRRSRSQSIGRCI